MKKLAQFIVATAFVDDNLPTPQFTRTYQLPDGTTFQLPFSAGPSTNVNLTRPNPTVGAINDNVSTGQSWYNNDATPPDGTNARRLQLALRFRF